MCGKQIQVSQTEYTTLLKKLFLAAGVKILRIHRNKPTELLRVVSTFLSEIKPLMMKSSVFTVMT